MSQWSDVYRQKLTTPEEAVKSLKMAIGLIMG